MSARVRELREQAEKLLADAARMKDEIRKAFGLGEHDGLTVFKVKKTKVRAYTRKGYIGVSCWG